MNVGAGSGPCTLLAVGSREHMAEEGWGAEVVDEAVAYARFAGTGPTRYCEGWLPRDLAYAPGRRSA